MGCIGSRLRFLRSQSHSSRSSGHGQRPQNVFPVLNVDDTGRPISPGKLEVTDTDLVLHVRGKPPLSWPLRCLRRYGFDNDLFSFESGRRCPTGAGIFAFRCIRAQSLFNLLQFRIQGNSTTTPNTVPSTPLTPTSCGGAHQNPPTPNSSTFVYVNLAENSSSNSNRGFQPSNAPDVTQVFCSSSGATASGPLKTMSTKPVKSSASDLPLPIGLVRSSSSCSAPASSPDPHPVYMNVDGHLTGGGGKGALPAQAPRFEGVSVTTGSSVGASLVRSGSSNSSGLMSQSQPPPLLQRGCASSSNPGPEAKEDAPPAVLYTNVMCAQPTAKTLLPVAGESAEINYVELDLKTDNHSSSTNPIYSNAKTSKFSFLGGEARNSRAKFGKSNSVVAESYPYSKRLVSGCQSVGAAASSSTVNNGELGYATIDFDRTAALSVVTRTKINLDFHTLSRDNNNSGSKSRHNSTAL